MDIAGLRIAVAMAFMNLFVVESARILGVFPIPLFSHQMVYKALMTELHSRGHEIVIITPYPMHNSSLVNYTEIDTSSLIDMWKKGIDYNKAKTHKESVSNIVALLTDLATESCKMLFDIPEIQNLIREKCRNERFDLVITAWFSQPCSNAFAYHSSAPLIGISTLGLLFSGHNAIGNPIHPVYFTEVFNAYLETPTFWQKLNRLMYYIWFMWHWHGTVLPQQDRIARRYFGDNMPYLEDLQKNVSLIFTSFQTNHYAVVPKVPALIELGAIHLKESKPLPKDLQTYLDGASGGAIYFSLGTNVRTENMSEERLNIFLDVFSQLTDFRIIWKCDGGEMPNLPSNVKTGKWFPQLDILAHPNTKVFIYQGGLHSTEEAINVQVPVIGFPFAVDQELNLKRIVHYGAGIQLDFSTVTKDELLSALKAIIYDAKYKSNMKILSDISKDQPQTPMERAVWWTEYAIRHKGARHMRSALMDVTWYEYLLLDVVAFLIVFSILIGWVTYYLCSRILRGYFLCHNKKEKSL